MKPKFKEGDLLRYADGPTALFRVTSIKTYNFKAAPRYYGVHIMGGTHGSSEIDCVLGDEEDMKKWCDYQNKYIYTKPEVVCLCGSTRYKKEFEEVYKQLTLEGKIVLTVGCFMHSGDEVSEEQKEMLDELHLAKIDLADTVFVLNVEGYIGKSTKKEIKYAKKMGKEIKYLEEEV